MCLYTYHELTYHSKCQSTFPTHVSNPKCPQFTPSTYSINPSFENHISLTFSQNHLSTILHLLFPYTLSTSSLTSNIVAGNNTTMTSDPV